MPSSARYAAIAALLPLVAADHAKAGTFNVPYERPAATIVVPDAWHPNESADGVDGASPDRSVLFFVSTFAATDCKAAQEDALRILTRDETVIDRASAKEDTITVAGRTGVRTRYVAKRPSGAARAVVITAPARAGECLQIAEWGTAKGVDKVQKDFDKLVQSIKPTGK